MGMGPTLLNMHQMIDMALGVPEFGIINMSMLQALLHVLVDQINVSNSRVEFLGKYAEMVSHLTVPKGDIIEMEEYSISHPDKLEKRELIKRPEQGDIQRIITIREIKVDQKSQIQLSGKSEDSIIFHMEELERMRNTIKVPNMDEEDNYAQMNKFWKSLDVSKRIEQVEAGMECLSHIIEKINQRIPFSDESIASASSSSVFSQERQPFTKDFLGTLAKAHLFVKQTNEILKTDHEKIKSQQNHFEKIFYGTMKEVQEMLDCKLDKASIPSLKQFIVDRLYEFKVRLDAFARVFALIPDASSTTCQLLRNLDCICCKRVVNQKDRETAPPIPKPSPAIESKVHKKICRDNFDAYAYFENFRPKDDGPKCNPYGKLRHAGGSFTKTTPDERKLRKLNFIKEYGSVGPNIETLMLKGTDGGMYRATPVECPCTCLCKRKKRGESDDLNENMAQNSPV